MEKGLSFKIVLCFLLIFNLGIISGGCSKAKIKKYKSEIDSPLHYTNNGYGFLSKNELNKAFESFDHALQLDPGFNSALVGTAIIYGLQKNYKAAFKQIKKAKGIEKQIGLIRLYSMERVGNWYSEVVKEFDKGINIDPINPELWYYTAYAHKLNFVFDKAGECFKKVLEINQEFTEEAKKEWVLIEKIQYASPDTAIGKKIVLIESIDRADLAALFIEEFHLDKLFEKKLKRSFDSSFKVQNPDEFQIEANKISKATDITNHIYRVDMEIIIDIQVRGHEVFPDHTFRPDKKVSRVEFAVIIEDILTKITGDDALTTKFIGSESPYSDIRNDHFAFNAVMTVTTRGILETKTNDEFVINDDISGIDALLAIKKLKRIIKQ